METQKKNNQQKPCLRVYLLRWKTRKGAKKQKEKAEQAPPSPRELAQSERANNPKDDVDLEVLVSEMNASLESLYSACNMQSDTVPLLQNGQHARSQPPASASKPAQPQASLRQKVLRSQPVHILAVRRLQEEDQQFRTSSLPAIPNPFPDLCGPGRPPVVTASSLPPQAPTKQDVKVFSEDGTSKVVEILTDMTARDLCQLLVYKSHCVDDNSRIKWQIILHVLKHHS